MAAIATMMSWDFIVGKLSMMGDVAGVGRGMGDAMGVTPSRRKERELRKDARTIFYLTDVHSLTTELRNCNTD